MLPDYLKSIKIKNVCGEKNIPILPCENKVIRRNRMNIKQEKWKRYVSTFDF